MPTATNGGSPLAARPLSNPQAVPLPMQTSAFQSQSPRHSFDLASSAADPSRNQDFQGRRPAEDPIRQCRQTLSDTLRSGNARWAFMKRWRSNGSSLRSLHTRDIHFRVASERHHGISDVEEHKREGHHVARTKHLQEATSSCRAVD